MSDHISVNSAVLMHMVATCVPALLATLSLVMDSAAQVSNMLFILHPIALSNHR